MLTHKKILLLIPNLDFGGAQNSFSRLSVELGKVNVVINVVFNKENMAEYPFGGPLIDLHVDNSQTLVGKAFNFLKRVYKLKAIKKNYSIDTAISFLEGADYVNILSRQNEKIIVNVRGSKHFDQNISGWLGFIRHRFLIPWFYNRADQIVTLNKGLKEELSEVYKIKRPIQVIYNAFDSIEIENLGKELIDEKLRPIFRSPTIISHGRLSIEKGYGEFIKAFAMVIKGGQHCKFVLLGEGHERMKIIDTCRAMGLIVWENDGAPLDQNADVFFLGYDMNPYKYLSRAVVFVLPSHHEGFGNSLAEAMICGLPAIASDCPYSPREILSLKQSTGSNDAEWADFGILIPTWEKSTTPEQWSLTIIKLLRNEELRAQYSQQSKIRMNDFTIARMMKIWSDLI